MEKNKKTTIKDFQTHEEDTGSPEVQVALITQRINQLTEHLRVHRHDKHTLRGLLIMVGKRQKLLKYLGRLDANRYRTLIARLNIRK